MAFYIVHLIRIHQRILSWTAPPRVELTPLWTLPSSRLLTRRSVTYDCSRRLEAAKHYLFSTAVLNCIIAPMAPLRS